MKELINKIKKDTGESTDIIYKEIRINQQSIYLIFDEVLCNGSDINDFILKNISKIILDHKTTSSLDELLRNSLPSNNIKRGNNYQDLLTKLFNGFTILLLDKENYLAIETRTGLNRGISEATNEPSIRGPKDAFIEHFNTNLGLIRRRIKSEYLWAEEMTIGKQTKTKIGICYMKNIAEESLIKDVKEHLKKISIDGIIDSGNIKEQLEEQSNRFFPTVLSTERPDMASQALLEGKVVIIVDTSPYVLIVPTFLIDFFHTTDDYYQKPVNITFIRVIRLICFLIAILIPAFYIAITTHNHDAIPIDLLINFASQRESVPFPALIEALIMSITFEILRESDTRMPSTMGTAISILGGLVLGDAAVSAGIVSPIMIIVIAISAISGLVFSSIEIISAIRWWRFLMMFFATFLGIYGIFLGGLFLVVHLSSMKSFGKPYLAPFAPIILSEQKDAIIKTKDKGVKKRNPLLTKKNQIRGRL